MECYMKKADALALLFALAGLALCGCLFMMDERVELGNCSFQYNGETNDYSVFFALTNKRGEYAATNGKVNIRIVDNDGNELYSATNRVTKGNFGIIQTKLRESGSILPM